MFCVYCGNKLPDDAKFCDMCGKSVEMDVNSQKNDTPIHVSKQMETTVVTEEKNRQVNDKGIKIGKIDFADLWKKYKDRWKLCKKNKFKGKKDIIWTVGNVVVIFLVIVRVLLSSKYNFDMNGIVYEKVRGSDTVTAQTGFWYIPYLGTSIDSEVDIKEEVVIGFKTYEVNDISISQAPFLKELHLDSEKCRVTVQLASLPNLQTLIVNAESVSVDSWRNTKIDKLVGIGITAKHSEVFLNANNGCPNLKSIRIEGKEDSSHLLWLNGDLPKLTEIDSCVVPEGDFVAKNLEKVTFRLSNSEVSKVLAQANTTYLSMYLNLPEDTTWESTHTIEDLYGKWVYKQGNKEVLSIQFQENGYVRVSDSLGIIGADVLKYSEVDESTLLLKAETNNMYGNLVSFQMTYILLGDELEVYILGNKFELIREK